ESNGSLGAGPVNLPAGCPFHKRPKTEFMDRTGRGPVAPSLHEYPPWLPRRCAPRSEGDSVPPLGCETSVRGRDCGATSVPSVILLRRIAQPATVFRSLHAW